MANLTVGANQAYTTIAAAVAASGSGDTISVMAGTYTNDFSTIRHDLTIQGVGGVVNLVATVPPPNGKAIIVEGGSGLSITINGLSFSGAKVADNNGAGIRYEGGTLTLNNDTFSGNQEGLLAGTDPNGVITISNSTFKMNGAGDGYSHNLYVNAIASLTVQNSRFEDAVVGHNIKSRAAATTITGNTITDTLGSASYEIDLPNGGLAIISGNVIEKGPNAQNPNGIAYGEEGNRYANGSLKVTNNVIVNDFASRSATAVWNATGTAATISGNTFYGWVNLTNGPTDNASNTVANSRPALALPAATVGGTPTPIPVPATAPTTGGAVVLGSGPDSIVLTVSEDAWQGDAQFTVSIDGNQFGGTQTATASHAAGQSQTLTLQGTFGITSHTVAVRFLNDGYGGTAATDRNLYVDHIRSGAVTTPGGTLFGNGTVAFIVGTPDRVVLGSGPDKLTLQMSQDAWQGDAQFTVQVDGRQVGGVQTAAASHAAGQSQQFDVLGAFGPGTHQVAVSFLNDAYGGTAATDRNLYVDGIKAGAVTTPGGSLFGNGTVAFIVGTPDRVTLGAGPDKVTLQMSEDAWQGDAQFTVQVDGRQVGGVQTAAASHAAGQSQQFDVLGAFGPGTHQVAVSFLNDAYGGTAATDRNLHVDSVGSMAVNATLYGNGTQVFTAILGSNTGTLG